jgi:hypothetical protein
MVKLIRKEGATKYPNIAKDLLQISSIPNWVELDLSKFSRDSLIGTGLSAVKNSGVYIHPDDIPLLNGLSVNFQEILSHSYGTSSDGTLTYRPSNQSTRVLVSIPLDVMRVIKNIRVLTDIDKILDFHRTDTMIYTTGSGGIKGYRIPNSYYGITEGMVSAQITDFTCTYRSLLSVDKQSFIEQKSDESLTQDQCFELLLGLLEFTPKNSRDKQLKKELMSSLIQSVDSSLFDEPITENLLIANKDILADLGPSTFTNTPKVKFYTYSMYFYTQNQVNSFLKMLNKDPKVGNSVQQPNVNRNAGTETNIYVFRPSLKGATDENKRKHILSILTCPTGQFKISQAIKNWNEPLKFSPTGHLDSVG